MSEPPSELEAFREHVCRFVEQKVVPNAEAWTARRSVGKDFLREAGEAGLLGLKYAREDGGLERPYAFTRVMLEELGRSGQMGCLLSLVLQSEFSTPHLAMYGSPSVKERFLRPAIRGEKVISIAMTEPEGGSKLSALGTTATPVAGGYRVRGRKWMIGNALFADAVAVVCNSPEQDHAFSKLTLLLVETRSEGFSMVRQLEKTGLHATPNCELAFEDCFVPEENVIGKPGMAGPQLLNGNVYERIAIALLSCAAMRAAWESAVRFLSDRKSGEAVLLDQSPWRHVLTEDYMRLEGCHRVVRDAAASVESGRPDQALILMAKIYATEVCQDVIQRAAQAHGARGFLAETLVGRLAADTRALTVGGGASEVLTDALSRMILPQVVRPRRGAK